MNRITIITGEQGVGKTTLARKMGGDSYVELLPSQLVPGASFNKPVKFIIIDAVCNARDIQKIKDFLTYLDSRRNQSFEVIIVTQQETVVIDYLFKFIKEAKVISISKIN